MMIADFMSPSREAILRKEDLDRTPSLKRSQGRPARGNTEVGKQKIVEGMRKALRCLGNTNVTRKDVASFAGVTPALVTYYFPERSDLIKSATLSVVETLLNDVKVCLTETCVTRQQLVQVIDVLRESYSRNAAIIEMFQIHREELALPDLIQELETTLETFFQRWIQHNDSVYDAVLLQKVTMGACKSTAGLQNPESNKRFEVAEMICSMLLGPGLGNWTCVAEPNHLTARVSSQ